MRGDILARTKLIAECAPLLAPALRPAEADRTMELRMAAFEEASRGRYGPLAEFLGLDPAYVEVLCSDSSGEPLALLCAATELRGFDICRSGRIGRQQRRDKQVDFRRSRTLPTGVLPGNRLRALLIRIGGR